MKTIKQYYSKKRSEVAEFLPLDTSDMRILEIGCGSGYFRSNIFSCKEYWAIEPNKSSAKLAEKNR